MNKQTQHPKRRVGIGKIGNNGKVKDELNHITGSLKSLLIETIQQKNYSRGDSNKQKCERKIEGETETFL